MKLVWRYVETDGFTYSCYETIPFEYSSKDDFILSVLEMCDKAEKEGKHYIYILGDRHVLIEDARQIESEVFTLEEWFETQQIQNGNVPFDSSNIVAVGSF